MKMNKIEALEAAILEYEKDLKEDSNNQWLKDVISGLKSIRQDLKQLEILNLTPYISALKQCSEEHEKEFLYTFQINTHSLCRDTAYLLNNIKGIIENEK